MVIKLSIHISACFLAASRSNMGIILTFWETFPLILPIHQHSFDFILVARITSALPPIKRHRTRSISYERFSRYYSARFDEALFIKSSAFCCILRQKPSPRIIFWRNTFYLPRSSQICVSNLNGYQILFLDEKRSRDIDDDACQAKYHG